MDGLDELGLNDNTYVIYMGDNGHGANQNAIPSIHPDSPAPLTGDKGNLSEGGIRVPFIIRGPGIEANSWSSVPIVGFDLFPTFSEWARIDPADLPVANPDYDPTKPSGFPGRARRGADPNVIVPFNTTFDPERLYFPE